MDTKNDYLIRSTYRSFMVASVLSALTVMLGQLIDNIIVGQFLGVSKLGTMGIISPIGFLFAAVGMVGNTGGSILASRALGRGDTDEVRNVFSVMVFFGAVIGVALTCFGLVFAPQLAALLGAEGELTAYSVQYLRGFLLGAVPMILNSSLTPFVQIDGSVRLPMASVLVMTVSDVIVDLLVVFLFNGSMFGIALASAVSYWLGFAVLLIHFRKKKRLLRLARPRNAGAAYGKMFGLALPIVVNSSSDLFRTVILNHLLAAVSVGAVAVMNVRGQAQNFVGALALGASMAVTPVVGMFFGEEDRGALEKSLRVALRDALVITGIAAVLLLLFPGVFTALLGLRDPETVAMSNIALRCFAVSLPVRAAALIIGRFYQTTGHAPAAVFLSVGEALLYPLLMSFLLIHPLGTTGVWLAFPIAEALTLVTVFVFVLLRGDRRESFKKRLLMLRAEFGGKEADKLSVSIGNSMDEVMEMARSVYAFGEARGVSKETMDKVSLCIEEMAGNIVQHSFKPGEKRWFDLLVYVKPEAIVLRMRDNGRPFDPLARLREQAESDPEKNLGLKVINGITDNFEYRNGIGLNICVMTLRR